MFLAIAAAVAAIAGLAQGGLAWYQMDKAGDAAAKQAKEAKLQAKVNSMASLHSANSSVRRANTQIGQMTMNYVNKKFNNGVTAEKVADKEKFVHTDIRSTYNLGRPSFSAESLKA